MSRESMKNKMRKGPKIDSWETTIVGERRSQRGLWGMRREE